MAESFVVALGCNVAVCVAGSTVVVALGKAVSVIVTVGVAVDVDGIWVWDCCGVSDIAPTLKLTQPFIPSESSIPRSIR